jgi:hypothetical protein
MAWFYKRNSPLEDTVPRYRFEYTEGANRKSHIVEAMNEWFAYCEIANFMAEKPERIYLKDSIEMTDFAHIDDPIQPWSTLVTKKKEALVFDKTEA